MRIGLLGGSFNPAHAGHRHISRLALARLGLDQVWWLVSPQNPLKPSVGMAGLEDRLRAAERAAAHHRIVPTAIEARLGTRFTAETLARLTQTYARARFVWLMGADNLIQIPKWRKWTQIFHTLPVAVFDRRSYSFNSVSGVAATRFAHRRVPEWEAATLIGRTPPAWVFLHIPRHPASSTAIRAGRAEQSRRAAARGRP